MKKIKVFSWDNGFDFEKFVVNKEKKEVFPSRIYQPTTNNFFEVESNFKYSKENMLIKAKEKDFFVGEKAIQQASNGGSRKFNDDKFKETSEIIKLLAGIELLTDDFNLLEIKNLALGLNIKAYKSYKEEVENTYSDRFFEYSVPGQYDKKRKVYIANVNCFAQGIGAFYDKLLNYAGNPENGDLLGKRYGLIDVGGKTTDTFIAEDTDIINDTVINLNKGTTDVFKRVASKLNGVPFDLIQKEYLAGNDEIYYNKYHQISSPCQKEFKRLAEEIYDEIQVKWNDYLSRVEFILLAGGGASSIKKHLQQKFDKKIKTIPNPQFANAQGYYKLTKFMQNNQVIA